MAYPEMSQLDLPEPCCEHDSTSEDQPLRVLKYLYSNQSFATIQVEVNSKNAYTLYAEAKAYRCENLMRDIEDFLSKIISVDTIGQIFRVACDFCLPQLVEKCQRLIITNFSEIPFWPSPFLLFQCPIAEFIKTIASNELKVSKEYDLVDIVRKCFEWHERKGVKVPVRPEDACAPEVW